MSTDILLKRRSIRKYKDTPVPEELLDKILEAGTFAPTGMNRQTPVMVAVTNKEIRDILEKENAKVMGDETKKPFYGAPAVIVVFYNPEVYTSFEDGCLVMGNLLNAAHAVGLGSCWIHRAKEMFNTSQGKELMKKWGIPENYIGVGNCIVGYPDETPEAKPRKDGYIIKEK
ncbi:MAG: nitroreductase family protein [Ruminococcaceae bacterium]|nr:nitroreductase family protein [Oscillospiraceae bacterium]MBR3595555.1 nitroreductase [Clostridia bacterium]